MKYDVLFVRPGSAGFLVVPVLDEDHAEFDDCVSDLLSDGHQPVSYDGASEYFLAEGFGNG